MKLRPIAFLFIVFVLLTLVAPALAQNEEALPPSVQLDFESLFQAFVKLVVTIVGVLVVRAGNGLISLLKVNLSASQERFVKSIITEVVLSTEQLAKSNKIADTASAKLLYAKSEVQKRLTDLGYLTLASNTDRIGSGIEAAVMDEFNRIGAGLLASWDTLGEPDEGE